VTWGQQFKNAVMLGPQIDEENNIEDVTFMEAFGHFAVIGWKVLFSLVPPSHYGGGLPAFVIALVFIGLNTAVVGSFAELLGCTMGIDDSITAITFVALGTSLPDTFASMTAARSAEYADAAIGNITGSNSVNVFLGLGLPWVIAVSYFDANQERLNRPYLVPAGEVAYSVFVFLVVAIICFLVLIARRHFIGGELGGPKVSAYASMIFLCILWVVYIVLSIVNASGT
jgi:solute carrier family 8 (sodium/calcium exchanger)